MGFGEILEFQHLSSVKCLGDGGVVEGYSLSWSWHKRSSKRLIVMSLSASRTALEADMSKIWLEAEEVADERHQQDQGQECHRDDDRHKGGNDDPPYEPSEGEHGSAEDEVERTTEERSDEDQLNEGGGWFHFGKDTISNPDTQGVRRKFAVNRWSIHRKQVRLGARLRVRFRWRRNDRRQRGLCASGDRV